MPHFWRGGSGLLLLCRREPGTGGEGEEGRRNQKQKQKPEQKGGVYPEFYP